MSVSAQIDREFCDPVQHEQFSGYLQGRTIVSLPALRNNGVNRTWQITSMTVLSADSESIAPNLKQAS